MPAALQQAQQLVRPSRGRPWAILVVAAALVLGGIAAESIVAFSVVLMDAVAALAVLAAAGRAGGWFLRLPGLRGLTLAERIVFGAGLGVGSFALLTLGLGVAGALTRPVAIGLAILLAMLGGARLWLDVRACKAAAESNGRVSWLWLLVCPFLAIALLAASIPPGVLWQEEANGYDVLEYHLAVPKTFHEAGRIAFLPNNVYGNFPLNSEMLSLFMMTLHGDAIEAAFMAASVNVGLAALFAAAAWLIGRRYSPQAGVVAGVLAASVPWITYLAGIAYVEVGMLAMGLCALAALLRAESRPLLAGLLAGLACGFKYTAVPLIAIPLAGLALIAPPPTPGRWRTRLRGVALYTLGAAIAFCPWLIRNVVNTGNPVFPLAYRVFGARAGTWDAELEARWQHAHGSAAAERADAPMWQRAISRTIADWRLGAPLLLFAAVGAIRHRDRLTVALLLLLAWQFAVWLGWTHLFARFAAVFVIPLIALAARAMVRGGIALAEEHADASSMPPGAGGAVGWPTASAVGERILPAILAPVLAAAMNLYPLARLYYHETRPGGVPLAAYDHLDWFVKGEWPGMQHLGRINSLDAGSKVLMVGDARTFYVRRPCEYATVFNRLPLADEVARDGRPQAVRAWLRKGGDTHVLANWSEMTRLRRTYGFYPEIDAALFERLMTAGLKPVASFSFRENTPPYATLFEVPP